MECEALTVCLLPACEAGAWLWVWHPVAPLVTLSAKQVRQLMLAAHIEQSLRGGYITMVKARGSADARHWVEMELQRMQMDVRVIEQRT